MFQALLFRNRITNLDQLEKLALKIAKHRKSRAIIYRNMCSGIFRFRSLFQNFVICQIPVPFRVIASFVPLLGPAPAPMNPWWNLIAGINIYQNFNSILLKLGKRSSYKQLGHLRLHENSNSPWRHTAVKYGSSWPFGVDGFLSGIHLLNSYAYASINAQQRIKCRMWFIDNLNF